MTRYSRPTPKKVFVFSPLWPLLSPFNNHADRTLSKNSFGDEMDGLLTKTNSADFLSTNSTSTFTISSSPDTPVPATHFISLCSVLFFLTVHSLPREGFLCPTLQSCERLLSKPLPRTTMGSAFFLLPFQSPNSPGFVHCQLVERTCLIASFLASARFSGTFFSCRIAPFEGISL